MSQPVNSIQLSKKINKYICRALPSKYRRKTLQRNSKNNSIQRVESRGVKYYKIKAQLIEMGKIAMFKIFVWLLCNRHKCIAALFIMSLANQIISRVLPPPPSLRR